MNIEQQFAERIRRALDESTAQLPYRVSYRLEAARQAALGRMHEPAPELQQAAATLPVGALLGLPSGSGVASLMLGGEPGPRTTRWSRLLLGAFAVTALVGGFVVINEWSSQNLIEQTADVDLAVLVDDIPISAYADRGFGVYIKNTHE